MTLMIAAVLASASLSSAPAAALAYPQALPAEAPAEPATTVSSGWHFEPSVVVASDYRFRGVSLSDRKPVVQQTLALTHDSGIYASLFISNVAENGGAGAELDAAIGVAREFGATSVDLSAVAYRYPGARAMNYGELLAVVRRQIGQVDAGLTLGYAPRQKALGGLANRYVAIDAVVPLDKDGGSFGAGIGLEDGAFGDMKRDWHVGFEWPAGPVMLGATYVDTARSGMGKLGKSAIVLSVSAPRD